MIMKTDHNTHNFTQWFFFKVSNTRRFRQYTFNLLNFLKPDSSFNQGMKPLMYSKREAETKGMGWQRVGEDIAYYANNHQRSKFSNLPGPQPLASAPAPSAFFTLSFKLNFKYDYDEVWLAYCYPYTYSDCTRHLQSLTHLKDRVRRTPLCRTLAGNDCEMLIITNFLSEPEAIALRPAVILTGRIHPGESNSSWIMEGLIDYVLSDEQGARILREKFVFKIVPMLNPDGVIVGNYRCSLAGYDLNR